MDRDYKNKINLYRSREDCAFTAEVPESPGCTAHVSYYEVPLRNIKDAIVLWIDMAQEYVDDVPCPEEEKLIYT